MNLISQSKQHWHQAAATLYMLANATREKPTQCNQACFETGVISAFVVAYIYQVFLSRTFYLIIIFTLNCTFGALRCCCCVVTLRCYNCRWGKRRWQFRVGCWADQSVIALTVRMPSRASVTGYYIETTS